MWRCRRAPARTTCCAAAEEERPVAAGYPAGLPAAGRQRAASRAARWMPGWYGTRTTRWRSARSAHAGRLRRRALALQLTRRRAPSPNASRAWSTPSRRNCAKAASGWWRTPARRRCCWRPARAWKRRWSRPAQGVFYGVTPITAEVVLVQQQVADLFHQQKLIPSTIRVSDNVAGQFPHRPHRPQRPGRPPVDRDGTTAAVAPRRVPLWRRRCYHAQRRAFF